MIKITVDSRVAQELAMSMQDFQVCAPDGKVLATVHRDAVPEFIAGLKRSAADGEPQYAADHVREMFATLQENWDREGPFGQARAEQIVDGLCEKWDK